MLPKILSLVLITAQTLVSNGEDILILQPFSPRSHIRAAQPIAKELGLRGHHVTFVSAFGFSDSPLVNVTEITYPQFAKQFQTLQDIIADTVIVGWSYADIKRYYYYSSDLCEQFFNSSLLQNWIMRGKKFPVVILDGVLNECIMPLWSFIGDSAVVLFTGTIAPQMVNLLNIPHPYSYVPFTLTHHTDSMDFYQRLVNSGYWVILKGLDYLSHHLYYENVILPYFPDAKSFSESLRNVSLVLANEDPVLTYPRPYLPTMVPIGGIQCRPSRPLENDELKNFVDSSGEDGFIFFSFGSIISGELIRKDLQNVFIRAFGQIKQRVVWKYESHIDGLTDNIMITQWAPQQDLLGHPKIRAFINHGGVQSLQEGIYHGVPLICLPLATDQPHICTSVESRGIGLKLDPSSVTIDQLVTAINEATTNREMHSNVAYYSQVFRDRIRQPLEKAVYWIEFVMRFQSAPHLRSASIDLNFFQLFLLDIIGFFIGVTALLVFICWLLMKLVYYIFNSYNSIFTLKIKTC